ncbi:chemotaxis protein CheW [Gracilinema caldarium]|uniref:Chemotaxis protein CheA n=1 Tax=Gracilinema caldarium (strain ATCC 51460 / DSM 7334 / H1) TaxID=744872 RepID=F8F2J3_GRAC1|nr:chemotaxis protein CheW [Gracilinema caldarium]AEJ19108.1 CheA signal transduction histidine kinase [Gracilinema caldarium DSM 7334]
MSDYLDPNNEELLKDFFSEAQMQVEVLEQNILVLENEGHNRDAVDEIFRAAHTLKGGAATVEMHELSSFTHLVEDVLDAIRSDLVQINEDVIDVLLLAIDIIKEMLDARMKGSVFGGDSSGIEQRLSALLPEGGRKGKQAGKAPSQVKTAAASVHLEAPTAAPSGLKTSKHSLTEYDILEMRQAAPDGTTIYRIAVTFNEDNVMNTVGGIQVFAALKGVSTVLRTVPDFEQLYEDVFHPVVEYYVASTHSLDDLYKIVSIPDVTLSAEIDELGSGGTASSQLKPSGAMNSKPAIAETHIQSEAKSVAQSSASVPEAKESIHQDESKGGDQEAEAKRAGKDVGSILRVDSKRIDNLLNLVSETVITKATFNQISNQFGELMTQLQGTETLYREKMKELFDRLPEYLEGIQNGRTVKEIRKEITERYGDLFTLFDPIETGLKVNIGKYRSTAQNLGRITGELQEGVMRIRMVPISQIFNRFPRLVRDLSKSLNKKVNLVIEGEETELDKSVIEDLLDPIMHSVRNCIDHGIEAPEVRLSSGKSETGTVLLKASNEGNMIIIEIADDGKGIDVEAVRAKAIERGLIHPNKELTDVEAFNLIFEPGFSTAKEITNISGRGVGLDVVRRQVEKLNGTVTVSSERGKGTRFTIKLPLTLAIIQGLLVRVGSEIYSIPITSVIESHRIRPSEIKMIDNYEVFNIRNDVISLLRLNRLFGIKTDEQREYYFVVIVGTAEKKMGLMVDSLIGEEDVVIKPLRDQFTNSPGIAGASILGDGSVSLIIDVSQLLELGLRKELEERRRREASVR